ncbi:MAG: phasin family protein [Dongiaceae bacterium]
MTKESRKAAEMGNVGVQPNIVPDLESLMNANGANLDALMKSSEALWAGMAQIGQEMVQFASSRLKENVELSGSVMQCGDPHEAFRMECDHARSATKRYLDEASKLMSLAAEVSQRSWAPIEDLTKETLGRLNPKP